MSELHLQMGEEEILQEYKYATKKFDQVRILAELNCVSKKEMATWLKEHGCEVDGRYFREPPQHKPKAEEPAPAQEAKADAGKPRLTLVPMQIVWDIAEIREYGCAKYPSGGIDNWKRVEEDRFWEAAFRHFLKCVNDHKAIDPESGKRHFQHLVCNLAFIAEMEKEDDV